MGLFPRLLGVELSGWASGAGAEAGWPRGVALSLGSTAGSPVGAEPSTLKTDAVLFSPAASTILVVLELSSSSTPPCARLLAAWTRSSRPSPTFLARSSTQMGRRSAPPAGLCCKWCRLCTPPPGRPWMWPWMWPCAAG